MTWIPLTILALVLIALVLMFNRMVSLRNRTQTAWADVDAQLKRRADLVPNLVETVKGYADHEQTTLERATEARVAAERAGDGTGRATAEAELTSAIGAVFAVAEQYPQLKASDNFLDLQKSLSDTEDKVAIARHVYNDTVQTYENAREQVPTNIVALLFGFKQRPFFEVDVASDRDTPQVRR